MEPDGVARCAALAAALAVVSLACEPAGAPALRDVDAIVVEKAARRLVLRSKGSVVRTYRVALGAEPVGHKQREGDERTPEGTYLIDARNPDSAFHRSLRISYPNDEDRRRGRGRVELSEFLHRCEQPVETEARPHTGQRLLREQLRQIVVIQHAL